MIKDGKTAQKFFAGGMPVSPDAIRQMHAEQAASDPRMTRAELLLTVWNDLPDRHRDELCRQIRQRCEVFIASAGVKRNESRNEIDSLFSEVVANILRATSARWKDDE
jgi:hypothetical protein